MKKGQLENGFKFEVDEKALEDMEVVDCLAVFRECVDEETEPDVVALKTLGDKILGAKQKKALYDHIREDDGRVDPEVYVEALFEVINKLGDEGKN